MGITLCLYASRTCSSSGQHFGITLLAVLLQQCWTLCVRSVERHNCLRADNRRCITYLSARTQPLYNSQLIAFDQLTTSWEVPVGHYLTRT